jgi:hypothetical protein
MERLHEGGQPSHYFHLHKLVKAYWKKCPEVTSLVSGKTGACDAWDGAERRACSDNARYFQECAAACVPREGGERLSPNFCANQRIQRWTPEGASIRVHMSEYPTYELVYAKMKMESNVLLCPLDTGRHQRTNA